MIEVYSLSSKENIESILSFTPKPLNHCHQHQLPHFLLTLLGHYAVSIKDLSGMLSYSPTLIPNSFLTDSHTQNPGGRCSATLVSNDHILHCISTTHPSCSRHLNYNLFPVSTHYYLNFKSILLYLSF